MEVKATTKTVSMAPRKMRLVIDLIRGKQVTEAFVILKSINQKAAQLITKTLTSACANAENNLGLKKEDLYVKGATIDEGRTLKRIRFGSRTHIDKHYRRTSHINIVLASHK